MAENKDDWDFDKDWSDDGFGSDTGNSASEKSGGSPFEEEDVFGGGAFDDTENPFGSDDDDNVFGGDTNVFGDDDGGSAFDLEDDGFGLQSMPTPGAFEATEEGDPEKEFEDISDFGDSGFADQDGFNDDDGLFAEDDDEPQKAVAEQDEDDLPDVFNQDSDEDALETSATQAADGGAKAALVKKAIMVGSVVAVGLVGYVGYDMLMGGSEEVYTPPAPLSEVTPQSTFPTGLPGQDGGLAIPPASSVVDNQNTGFPPSLGQELTLPSVEDNGDILPPDVVSPVELPSLGEPVEEVVTLPQPSLPSAPSLPGLDDLVGGPNRGGVDALKASEGQPEVAPVVTPAVNVDLGEIEGRIDAIERLVDQKINALSERIDRLADRIESSSAQPTLPSVSMPMTATKAEVNHGDLSKLMPPLKPLIVEAASLKGVSRDVAWVSTPSGVVEVKVGDTVPGAGRVNNIVNYNGNWMIISDEGLIIQ